MSERNVEKERAIYLLRRIFKWEFLNIGKAFNLSSERIRQLYLRYNDELKTRIEKK